MNIESVLAGLIDVTVISTDVLAWLNNNIFKYSGTVVDVLKKVIDFIKDFIKGDTIKDIGDFFTKLFAGDFSVITDFFKNLF